MTDTEVKAALTDRQALTLTLWGEARGERFDGKQAVAAVIRNRTKGGKSYRAVCLAPLQFSCWNDGEDANHQSVMKLARQLLMLEPAVDTLTSAFLACAAIAEQTISGELLDPTDRATNYCTIQLMQTHPPKWALSMLPTCTIGGHIFFRERHHA